MRVHRGRLAAALGLAAMGASALAAHAATKTAQFDVTTVNVGQGAQDDGVGATISMEAAHLMHRLGIVPRKMVRQKM